MIVSFDSQSVTKTDSTHHSIQCLSTNCTFFVEQYITSITFTSFLCAWKAKLSKSSENRSIHNQFNSYESTHIG